MPLRHRPFRDTAITVMTILFLTDRSVKRLRTDHVQPHRYSYRGLVSYFREDQWAAATIWGCPRTEAESKAGFRELGIEQCPPILTRGVLLDMPRSKGLDVLPDSYGSNLSLAGRKRDRADRLGYDDL